ncbi:MAG TPA: peptidase [Clostridiales bacterium]|jgi:hypothetical protein|nr:peptidase [Clostridiales bacterium]
MFNTLADTYAYLFAYFAVVILTFVAQIKVKSNYATYSRMRTATGYSGAEVAQKVLEQNGVFGVSIERVKGQMTDHYDPRTNTIRLSEGVFDVSTIAAAGIAAHEAGHAVQYAKGYAPVKFRTAILPLCQLGSNLVGPLLLIGLILSIFELMILGIAFFGIATFFQLVTLPVEFNASKRAMTAISSGYILREDEQIGARKMLSSAALTYVAALAVSLLNLLRFISIVNSRRR